MDLVSIVSAIRTAAFIVVIISVVIALLAGKLESDSRSRSGPDRFIGIPDDAVIRQVSLV